MGDAYTPTANLQASRFAAWPARLRCSRRYSHPKSRRQRNAPWRRGVCHRSWRHRSIDDGCTIGKGSGSGSGSVIAAALAIVLAIPAAAQQSMHRYASFFKYSDQAIKAMTENPQDRKLDSIYWFATGGEFDGIAIWQYPDDVTAEASNMMARATGNFANTRTISLLNSQEFKAAAEKVKGVKSSYTAPSTTKQ
jgi:uncharacterized protein with GYD domain